MPATDRQRAELESDPYLWRWTLFDRYLSDSDGAIVEDAPHHRQLITWIQAIEPGKRARPFVAIWPRGGAKSTNAEIGTVQIGAMGKRAYAWYISEVQEQADDHVETIGAMLESDQVATFYPDLARRRVNKYGSSRGWRRNRLSTAAGFTIDAVGLDTAARGIKIEEDRPGLLVFDDIDGRHDSQNTTEKKIETITQTLIPAGSEDRVLLFIQNLVHPTSVFSRIVDGTAGFLQNRILSGPIPAIEGLTYAQKRDRILITGGTPTWAGQDLETCQTDIDEIGISAFLQEAQHDVEAPPGGMFDHLDLRALRIQWEEIPPLDRVVCWVDPAVTKSDQSDSQAIQIDGIAGDTIYRLYSWEERATPQKAIKQALAMAAQYGATYVGIETDQGGETWLSVFREAKTLAEAEAAARGDKDLEARIRRLQFAEAKAGQGQDPKAHRASMMLADYERPGMRIRHAIGTHLVLEQALRRFPKTKPLDLVDAAYWSWDDLRNGPELGGWAPETEEELEPGQEPPDPYAAERRSRIW